jgi:hypothetical protein
MRRTSRTLDAVRAVIAPAKAEKRRPIHPIDPTKKQKAPEQYLWSFLYGAEGQNRTADTGIFSNDLRAP